METQPEVLAAPTAGENGEEGAAGKAGGDKKHPRQVSNFFLSSSSCMKISVADTEWFIPDPVWIFPSCFLGPE